MLDSEYDNKKIEPVQGTIKDLICRKFELGSFDLIYSAGLYDCLSDKAVRLLTKILFGMLKQNNRLLVANFLLGNKEFGYMEAFMDWEIALSHERAF